MNKKCSAIGCRTVQFDYNVELNTTINTNGFLRSCRFNHLEYEEFLNPFSQIGPEIRPQNPVSVREHVIC